MFGTTWRPSHLRLIPSHIIGILCVYIWIIETEDGVHFIVLHVGPYPGNPTRKSDLAPGFIQGKFFIIWEAIHAVICDAGSASAFIRPPDLDGTWSCDGEKIATNNTICLVIMTTTHAWGSIHSCIYIHLKIKRFDCKVTLTRLEIIITLECHFFVTIIFIIWKVLFVKRKAEQTHKPWLLLLLNFARCLATVILLTWQVIFTLC